MRNVRHQYCLLRRGRACPGHLAYAGTEHDNRDARVKPAHDAKWIKTEGDFFPSALPNPPHARDFAAGGADARDRLSKRLERHSHVEGVGVNERAGIAHDRHMPFPENEIATTQAQLSLCVGGPRAESALLHVAVARADMAGGGERDLDKTRAIDAERGLAAPQIRHAKKALGDSDKVRFDKIERRQ